MHVVTHYLNRAYDIGTVSIAGIFSQLSHTHTHTHTHTPQTGLSLHEKLNECRQLCPPLLPHIPNILVSLGKDGLVHAQRREGHWEGGGGEVKLFHHPPAASSLLPVGVVNVTGAGDRCGVQFDLK